MRTDSGAAAAARVLGVSIVLDPTDRKILEHLQRDARTPNKDLALAVDLSEAACWRRVQRLHQSGVIRRVTAQVDRLKVGRKFVAFVDVSLQQPHFENTAQFEADVQAVPEILECHRLLGEVDYRLKVVVADLEAYNALYINRISRLTGVATTVSRAVMHEVKHETALPLEAPDAPAVAPVGRAPDHGDGPGDAGDG